ncbi:MAG: putative DNA-binding protein [Variovorax sp.]|nr:putative DNA-binding protein [Variovorax sp.]
MQDTTGAPAGHPPFRTVVHPGPLDPVRIAAMSDTRGRHLRLILPSGRSIHESLVKGLTEEGISSASMTLLDGDLETLVFCLAQPDPSGQRVAMYGQPHSERNARFIFGNATLGKSVDGSPSVHCHAAFRTESGTVRGGHVLTDRTVVGRRSIAVVVTALDSFELRIGFDDETRMPLMRPRAHEANQKAAHV